jgi:hypothetical protein
LCLSGTQNFPRIFFLKFQLRNTYSQCIILAQINKKKKNIDLATQ